MDRFLGTFDVSEAYLFLLMLRRFVRRDTYDACIDLLSKFLFKCTLAS